MIRLRADRSAHVEHDRVALERRPEPGNRGAFDTRHGAQIELRHRHQRAGVSGRDGGISLTLLDGIDREPHRGFPAATPECLARLVVHPDDHFGMDYARGCLQTRTSLQQRPDRRLVTEQHELRVGMALQRNLGTGNDDCRTDVAPHRVERNSDLLGHGLR